MALEHWRLIESIAVEPEEAGQEVARLVRVIRDAVTAHYRDGVEKMGQGDTVAARNHFLTALRLDPAFAPARQQIVANFSHFPLMAHRVGTEDRAEIVAKNVYGDAANAFLVTWFNDLPQDGPLPPDSVLILPNIKPPLPKKVARKQPADRLSLARRRLAAGNRTGALDLLKQMDGENPAVRSMIQTIHLEEAAGLIEAGDFDAARQILATLPAGLDGRAALEETLQAASQNQRLVQEMERAQTLFDRQAYQQSLDLAESVVSRAPEHQEARDLANEARYRIAREHFTHGRLLDCRSTLAAADAGHAASMRLMEEVQARLVEQAQIHYRNGVKHFINEDLEAAVQEWEQALVCDPDHQKARENIDNARHLMQKLEKLPE
jgi:hypothetical protein